MAILYTPKFFLNTYIYIYLYIYRERERDKGHVLDEQSEDTCWSMCHSLVYVFMVSFLQFCMY